MQKKTILIYLVKLLAAVALLTGLNMFCDSQTKGFRPYLIVSNLPNDPRWEVPPLAEEEQKQITSLLDQSFSYLGAGGWCIAFLGEDRKTVLKFFRHTHLLPSTLLKDFSLGKLLMKAKPLPQGAFYHQEFNFKSCTLLYKESRELTGLLYVHLNKTQGLHKPVTLIDNIGVKHTIDLDQTEFVVQKRATLLLEHIDHLAKHNKKDEAKRCLDDMIACLLALYKRGHRDYDHSLRNNFGYTEDGAVTLDLSSFGFDESLKKSGEYRKEVIIKTRRLSRFLDKNHKDLSNYFEQKLNEVIENE
jgi:hypothetical protein